MCVYVRLYALVYTYMEFDFSQSVQCYIMCVIVPLAIVISIDQTALLLRLRLLYWCSTLCTLGMDSVLIVYVRLCASFFFFFINIAVAVIVLFLNWIYITQFSSLKLLMSLVGYWKIVITSLMIFYVSI